MAETALKIAPEFKRKRLKALDFSNHRPNAATLRTVVSKPKPDPVRYEDVFGAFKPYRRTTGEDMMIIRVFMHKRGLPEIPEHFRITEFASAMQWKLLPRHAWQHFYLADIVEARRFLAEWARALLPQLSTAAAA